MLSIDAEAEPAAPTDPRGGGRTHETRWARRLQHALLPLQTIELNCFFGGPVDSLMCVVKIDVACLRLLFNTGILVWLYKQSRVAIFRIAISVILVANSNSAWIIATLT